MRRRTGTLIKNYIANLARTQLFTTRDFLGYGSKHSIYQVMHRLVEQGAIQRLARGVFARPEVSLEDGEITAVDVAKAKARAFGRWCACSMHGASVNVREEVLPDGSKQVIVPVHGSTTSFMFGDTRIVLSGKGKVHHDAPVLAGPARPGSFEDDVADSQEYDDDEPDPEYLQWLSDISDEDDASDEEAEDCMREPPPELQPDCGCDDEDALPVIGLLCGDIAETPQAADFTSRQPRNERWLIVGSRRARGFLEANYIF